VAPAQSVRPYLNHGPVPDRDSKAGGAWLCHCGRWLPGAASRRANVTWRGANLSAVSQGGEISVSRVFDAPRELVYRAFVDPDQLCQWFGPTGFSVPCETVQSDVRTGGFQRFMLVSDADPTRRTPVDVALNEVVEDELLVAHADIGAVAGAGRTARIRLRLEFLDQSSGSTRLELRQDPSRHEICEDPEAAWESSFTRLDSLLRRSL
jgi:uncharacterized protein YndB with AHSA1/START domain